MLVMVIVITNRLDFIKILIVINANSIYMLLIFCCNFFISLQTNAETISVRNWKDCPDKCNAIEALLKEGNAGWNDGGYSTRSVCAFIASNDAETVFAMWKSVGSEYQHEKTICKYIHIVIFIKYYFKCLYYPLGKLCFLRNLLAIL